MIEAKNIIKNTIIPFEPYICVILSGVAKEKDVTVKNMNDNRAFSILRIRSSKENGFWFINMFNVTAI
jgi:hypothetical protein